MNPTFLDTYGWILYEQGSYFMAKIYIEKAIANSKDNPSAEVLEHYGDVLYQTGEDEKALEQWKKPKNWVAIPKRWTKNSNRNIIRFFHGSVQFFL